MNEDRYFDAKTSSDERSPYYVKKIPKFVRDIPPHLLLPLWMRASKGMTLTEEEKKRLGLIK